MVGFRGVMRALELGGLGTDMSMTVVAEDYSVATWSYRPEQFCKIQLSAVPFESNPYS